MHNFILNFCVLAVCATFAVGLHAADAPAIPAPSSPPSAPSGNILATDGDATARAIALTGFKEVKSVSQVTLKESEIPFLGKQVIGMPLWRVEFTFQAQAQPGDKVAPPQRTFIVLLDQATGRLISANSVYSGPPDPDIAGKPTAADAEAFLSPGPGNHIFDFPKVDPKQTLSEIIETGNGHIFARDAKEIDALYVFDPHYKSEVWCICYFGDPPNSPRPGAGPFTSHMQFVFGDGRIGGGGIDPVPGIKPKSSGKVLPALSSGSGKSFASSAAAPPVPAGIILATAADARARALALTGLAEVNTAAEIVLKDSDLPFLSGQATGHPVWRVEFKPVKLNLPSSKGTIPSPERTFVAMLDKATGKLVSLVATYSGPADQQPLALSAADFENRLHRTASQIYTGFPPADPKLDFVQAMDKLAQGGPPAIFAPEIVVHFVLYSKLGAASIPAWVIIQRGITLPPMAIPAGATAAAISATGDWVNVIDAMTGQLLLNGTF